MFLKTVLLEVPPNFFAKNWYYICALILSLTGVVMAIKNYLKKAKTTDTISNIQINPTTSPSNIINFNVGDINNPKTPENQVTTKLPESTREFRIDALKSKVKILFIDDDNKFNVVKILKDSGWKNTNFVVDLKSIDNPMVRETDIFFVDINGVGKLLSCPHEGLDIALMLKQKYPNKKVVIYSANKNNNAFHQAWDKCDFKLEKNALPYQFQSLVEQYSLDLYS